MVGKTFWVKATKTQYLAQQFTVYCSFLQATSVNLWTFKLRVAKVDFGYSMLSEKQTYPIPCSHSNLQALISMNWNCCLLKPQQVRSHSSLRALVHWANFGYR